MSKEFKVVMYLHHGYPCVPDERETIDLREWYPSYTDEELESLINNVSEMNEIYQEWLVETLDTGWFREEEDDLDE